jgi:hypothetical protein
VSELIINKVGFMSFSTRSGSVSNLSQQHHISVKAIQSAATQTAVRRPDL